MILRAILFLLEVVRMGYRVYVVNPLWNKPKLRKEVQRIYASRGLPFDRSYFHRIYYHLLLSSVTNMWFSTLRGKRETKKEMIAAAYLGASTPLYDDLYDESDYNRQDVQRLITQGNAEGFGIIAALGIEFYQELLTYLNRPETFADYLERVAIAQDNSKAQVGQTKLSEAAIRKITYDKGGYSIALYRSVLNHEMKPGEDQAVYDLGCMIQLTNDLFDLRKDYMNGQQTLVTATDDINKVRKEYLSLLHKTIASFKDLEYAYWSQKRFILQLMLIVGRGMVCLDQLARVQEKYGQFDVSLMQRSESVCDMEKPINLIRSFWYSVLDPAGLE